MPRVSPFHPSKKKISYSWRGERKEEKERNHHNFHLEQKKTTTKETKTTKKETKKTKKETRTWS